MKSKFIPYPNQDELDADEKWEKKRFGECYKCTNHLQLCAICMKTGMPLTYPIKGCYGKNYS